MRIRWPSIRATKNATFLACAKLTANLRHGKLPDSGDEDRAY